MSNPIVEKRRLGVIALLAAALVVGPSIGAQAAMSRGGPSHEGVYASFTEHEVRVANGDDTLAATVLVPEGAGPFPGVVLVHGSHQATRAMWPYRLHAEFLARGGIAVAIYDKRGAGASTGNYRESESFDLLAKDAEVVHAVLRRTARVDSARVGLWGRSQGGWVVARAAAREPSVAFLALIVGGGVTGREQNIFARQMQLRNGGAAEATIERVTGVWDALWKYMATGRDRDRAVREVAALRAEPWFGQVAETMAGLRRDGTLPDSAWVVANARTELTFFTVVHPFDPVPFVRDADIPVLGVFGGADNLTPAQRSVERLEPALRSRRQRGSRLVVFPGADHMLCAAQPGGGMQAGCDFVPGYEELVRDWILDRMRPRD